MNAHRPTETRLTADELGGWRGLLRVQSTLLRELDAELITAHALPLRSYEVLLMLEDAPGRRLRMTGLSRSVLLSPSGVTRLVDRLEREGFVDRERCPDDGRGFFAVLTDAGARRVQEARVTHLAGVRRLFLDRLSPADLRNLSVAWERVVPGASGSDDEWRRSAARAGTPDDCQGGFGDA